MPPLPLLPVKELNEFIESASAPAFALLSARGRALFSPRGILAQANEAREKAHRFNASLGIAIEKNVAMNLDCVMEQLPTLTPDAALRYAPPMGLPELRAAWARKQEAENPSQRGKPMSQPVVTCALTHGLSIVGDLFVDSGDVVMLPDKLWGNYRLIFGARLNAVIGYYPLYDEKMRFNVAGIAAALKRQAAGARKLIVILNFPNNPTGYTPTLTEARALRDALVSLCDEGVNIVAVCDDAYFGLCYTPEAMRESMFALLAGAHERLLAARVDGATKELFVWGFRVGFITFSIGGAPVGAPLFEALEQKAAGAIRGTLSNAARLSQEIVLRALKSPRLAEQRQEKYEVLKARALRLRQILADPANADAWDVYPFNSGYFMCIRVKGAGAEEARRHLLDARGIGLIAASETDLRIAFSCIELEDLPELVRGIRQGIIETQRKSKQA